MSTETVIKHPSAVNFSAEGAPVATSQIHEFLPESFIVDHKRNRRWTPEGQATSHDPEKIFALANGILMAYSRLDPSRPASVEIDIDADGSPLLGAIGKDYTSEEVAATVKNFVHGQQAPVGFVTDNGRPRLRFGFGRVMATNLLNTEPERFKDLLDARLGITPDDIHEGNFGFTVRAIERNADAQSELLDNVLENGARIELTDMDWGVICRDLSESGGPGGTALSYPKVAELLAPARPTGKDTCSSSWVQQHVELLSLAPELQLLVHQGKMSVFKAVEVLRLVKKDEKKAAEEGSLKTDEISDAELEEWRHERQQNILEQMRDPESGEVTRERQRQVTRAESAERGAPNTKTISELKRACREQVEICKSKDAQTILNFLEGKLSDQRFVAWLQKSGDEDMLAAAKKAKAKSGKSGEEKAKEAAAQGKVNLPPKAKGGKKAAKAKSKAKNGGKGKAQVSEDEVKNSAALEADDDAATDPHDNEVDMDSDSSEDTGNDQEDNESGEE